MKSRETIIWKSGVDERHIVEMAFDLFDNIEYRDLKVFSMGWLIKRIVMSM